MLAFSECTMVQCCLYYFYLKIRESVSFRDELVQVGNHCCVTGTVKALRIYLCTYLTFTCVVI